MVKSTYQLFLIVLVILIHQLDMICQIQVLDSLLQSIENAENENERCNLLAELAYEYHASELEKSIEYNEVAYALAKKISNKECECFTLTTYGLINVFKGDAETALEYSMQAYDMAIELDDHKLIAKCCGMLSAVYNSISDNEKSISYALEGLRSSEILKDTFKIAALLNNIGFILMEEDKYTEAKKYFDRLESFNIEKRATRLKLMYYWGKGTVEYKEGAIESGKSYLKKGLDLAEESKDSYWQGAMYEELGRINIVEQSWVEAENNLLKALALFESIGMNDLIMNTRAELSKVYNADQNYKKSIIYSQEGLAMAQASKSTEHIAKFSEQLSLSHEKIGKWKEALQYQKEYKVYSDTLLNTEKSNSIIKLESDYQMTLMEEEQIRNKSIIERQKSRSIISFLLLLLVSSIALMFWNNYRSKLEYSKSLELEVNERTAELEASNRKIKTSNEELERFAYISAHDLKEPLRNIASFSELINRKLNNSQDEKIKSYFEVVSKNTKRLSNLIDDILNYSTINNNIVFEDTNLNKVIIDVKNHMTHTLQNKNVEINHERLPIINSNASQMYQVFKNIIDNGVKYNESITPKINIKYKTDLNFHYISIQDNGIGFDQKYVDQVFVMFKRLQNREIYEGTGIGLSIAKKIIGNMGGKIKIESQIGKGTTVNVLLPIA